MNAIRDVLVECESGLHMVPVGGGACDRCEKARERLARELAETVPYRERLAKAGGVVVWGDESEVTE